LDGSAGVRAVENSLVEARRQDKIIETADDGRQREFTWEMSVNSIQAEENGP
jgi:hypothetical protein